jgi:Kef-type K+ transport system membrane component KefB
MMSRGEVGLIVASVGIAQGIIDQQVFSAVVGVVILTTILTPVMLRLSFNKKTKKLKVQESEEFQKTTALKEE